MLIVEYSLGGAFQLVAVLGEEIWWESPFKFEKVMRKSSMNTNIPRNSPLGHNSYIMS